MEKQSKKTELIKKTIADHSANYSRRALRKEKLYVLWICWKRSSSPEDTSASMSTEKHIQTERGTRADDPLHGGGDGVPG